MNIIKNIFKNQYITTFISILILLYSATINNNISKYKYSKNIMLKLYTKIFNHHFFRLIYLIFILCIFNYDVKIALSLTIAFIMINISITNNMVDNSFGQFENFLELEHFSDNTLRTKF